MPRKTDLDHQTQAMDGKQSLLQAKAQLLTTTLSRKPNSAAKGLRENNLSPTSFIRASFPLLGYQISEVRYDEGFRGERKTRKYLRPVHGRGRGRNEGVWGREEKPIPPHPL